MITSPQTVQVTRGDLVQDATVTWRYEDGQWLVEITSAAFGPIRAREDDAFEALCRIREQLEPDRWRIGVAGAQVDVWPSGMSRDQGGGLVAYRMTVDGAAAIVDTFSPVDVSTVVALADQRAEIDRLNAERQGRS